MYWLPEPPPGTQVCGGFDGSEVSDFTAIKLETIDGLIFTPRWGPDGLPAIWDPSQHDGHIPRPQVRAAWEAVLERFDVERVYCDPGFHDETSWETEIEEWASAWNTDAKPIFVAWPTNSLSRMFPAVRRFESDLKSGEISHDGCPITTAHMRNARKLLKRQDVYTLGKPAQNLKIDAAVTSVLAHEAAADARAAGWGTKTDSRMFVL